MERAWPRDRDALVAEQERLRAVECQPWEPGVHLRVVAAFVAFHRGEQGPGRAGDRAWVAAALTEGPRLRRVRVVAGTAGAEYLPGLLALREGSMLEAALAPLAAEADVLMLDASGRDHPRRAGLAVQLGERWGLPSVGVTHRPLLAVGSQPGSTVGATSPVTVEGEQVGCWVRTAPGVRAVVAHAAWRTTPDVAADVVLRCCAGSRTPEPLRHARRAARERRSACERLDNPHEVLGHA